MLVPIRPDIPVSPPAGPHARSGIGKLPLRVLVVDDYQDTAENLVLLLQLWGHEAQAAHDGPGALTLAAQFRPQVILLDIGLGGLSGLEVARQLRADRRFEGTVLVAMTGYGGEEDRRRTRDAGFNLHLVKPVEPAALQALLASLAGLVSPAGKVPS